MNQGEFEALKATFPWSERVISTISGGLVQIIDRNGNEVPMFVMTNFLVMITQKLAKVPEEQKELA